MPQNGNRAVWQLVLILGAGALALYRFTMAPGLLAGDSAEFMLATGTLGLVHPTGYPLYLVAGSVWTHLLPFGDLPFRLNLFSAFLSAVTVSFVGLVLWQSTTRFGASFLGAAALAAAGTFWSQATETEVYALNSLLVAVLIGLLVSWQATRRPALLVAWCFVLGLAVAHHRLALLFLPGAVLFFLLTPGGSAAILGDARTAAAKARAIGLGLLAFLVPLLLYLYIPLRLPATPYLNLEVAPGSRIMTFDDSLPGFWEYILGQRFQPELAWTAQSQARLTGTLDRLASEFNGMGLLIAFAGLLRLIRMKHWGLLALTVGGAAAVTLFNAAYGIGDINDYYTPVLLVVALWIGSGAAELERLLSQGRLGGAPSRRDPPPIEPSRQSGSWQNQKPEGRRSFSVFALAGVLILVALVPALNLAAGWQARNRSGVNGPRQTWERIMALPLSQTAILVSNDRDEIVPLWYLQYVEGRNRDWLGLFPLVTFSPEYSNVGRVVSSVLNSGRAVYLIKPMAGLECKFPIIDRPGQLAQVSALPYPAPEVRADATLGSHLAEQGFTLAPATPSSGTVAQVALYWEVKAPLGRDYTSFLHLLDNQGKKVAQGDDHRVCGDYYPSSLWQPGDTIRDVFRLQLPPDLPPGTYRFLAGMYTQPVGEALADPVQVGTTELK